jgi:hypothetical protein
LLSIKNDGGFVYKTLLFFFLLVSVTINAQQLNNSQNVLNKTDKSYFIENKGQWPSEVKYLARIGGMNAWITSSGVVYDYYKITKNIDAAKTLKMDTKNKSDFENKNTSIQGHVVKLQLVNEENDVIQQGNNQRAGYCNYFIGNDKSKWAANVPLYDNVELQGVYKDIDVKYYYDNGMLRYDYKAKPGADISQIKFKFEGQEGISINEKGELILKTSLGEVTNGKIYAYQSEGGTQKEVACKFEQRQDGTVGLKAESYDAKKELIIDPLVYSTFVGGNGEDEAFSITADASGNAYITGYTVSTDYPVTSGAYKITNGGNNVFVTKLNPTCSNLVYSTYIGGSNYDWGQSIAIDAAGNAYITGYTKSSNYPATTGAFQTALRGSANAFVTKLNSTGSALLYSTFIGGNSYDMGNSIAIDAGGDAYITGYTLSSNYPATTGAFQTALRGSANAFVTKLNSTGSALLYSTFIGGTSQGYGYSIAVDAGGDAYITGYTNSSDYPTTSGAYQTALKGGENTFVTKLNSTGSALLYSTFIGGSGYDEGNSIAIDAGGNAYISGVTNSSDYPTTTGAFQTAFGGGDYDALVTKLNSTGSALLYSTFIGGSGYDYGYSIAVDAAGNAYITGYTKSSNYPATTGAFQTASGGYDDAFVTKLNSTGSALLYSTFIGGSDGDDEGNSIALDAGGSTYVAGFAGSSDFPTTTGAFQTAYNGTVNAFVTKFYMQSAPGAVQLLSPAAGSTGVSRPVTVKWSPVSTAAGYRLQLSTDSLFAATAVDTTGLTDTTFTVGSLSNLTKYYWRVNATNAAGTSVWSTVWNFKTLGNPTQAVLLYPAANSVNIPVTVNFSWNPSQDQLAVAIKNGILKNAKSITSIKPAGNKEITNISKYWFELITDTTSKSYVVNDSTLADTARLVSGLNNLTNYWWRVKAMNETGWGTYTGWSKFTTIIDTPDVVTLSSPLNSSVGNTQPVQLKWKSSARAAGYRVQFGTDSTFVTTILDTNNVFDTTFIVSNLSNLTKYYWRVNAINVGGISNWCAVWNFKTLGSPIQPGIIYPLVNSSNIPLTVNFSWNKSQEQLAIVKLKDNVKNAKTITNSAASGKKEITNISKYWFELITDTTSKSYVVNDSTLTDTTIQVTELKNLTNYWWRVKGMNETGWGAYTGWSKFTTIIDTPGVAILLSPNSSSVISDTASSILFKWDSASFAGTYELQVASDVKFNTVIIDTSGLTDTVFAYHPKKLVSAFYWKLRASNVAGEGSWSSIMTVSVISGIDNMKSGIPVVYKLYQNYPNPFNPSSKIRYALPFNSTVRIEIYNVLGQKVKELLNTQKTAGYYEVNFNTNGLASGVYLYMLYARSTDGKSEFRDTKKMMLLK